MPTVTITAEDTFVIFDRVFTDFADGDVSSITYPNDFAALKSGKNNNTIISKNATGNNADVVLRLNRGSSDDTFLQGKLALAEQDFAAQELANGRFVKRLGDGLGNITNDTVTLFGGVITKKVETKENAEGDTTQGVAVYNMKFSNAKRNNQ